MQRNNWSLGAVLVTLLYAPTIYAQDAKPSGAKPPGEQTQKKTPAMDPQTDALLKEMSAYLRNLPNYSFVGDFSTEVVMQSGEKLNFDGQSQVLVDRRYGIRSDRLDSILDVSLYYNRKSITVFRRGSGFYASAEAPAEVDKALDFARDDLKLDAPGADLLYSDVYAVLTDGVTATSYLGVESVNGVAAHHIGLRGGNVDVQLWVRAGGPPLPVKYVITTKDVKGEPQYVVNLHDWNVAPRVSADMFTFHPPPGAMRIDFINQPGRQLSKQQPGQKPTGKQRS